MTTQTPETAPTPLAPRMPEVRALRFHDILDALRLGLKDFIAAPLMGLFFGGVYALGGIVLTILLTRYDMIYLVFPLVIGFILIGPFVAVGLYEISRRRERGAPLTWSAVLGVIWQQRQREFMWMAFVVLFVFWIWIYQVRLLLALFLGSQYFSDFPGFLHIVFTTQNGWWFLLVGNLLGAGLSLALFSLTVVSCPLLLDREVDFVTALITSVKSVVVSGPPMVIWGLSVAVIIIVSSLPAFLGLLLTLPILGHTTWHLYRKAVKPA